MRISRGKCLIIDGCTKATGKAESMPFDNHQKLFRFNTTEVSREIGVVDDYTNENALIRPSDWP